MKRWLILLFILMTSSIAAAAPNQTWHATYWNNTELAGSPVLVRDEPFLFYRWNRGSPAPGIVNRDEFSARWTRTINFSAGTWEFKAAVDDGVRVFIDGELLIDGWRLSSFNTLSNATYLTAGEHEIVVEYFEQGGEAVMQLTWDKLLDAEQPNAPAPTSPPVGAWQGVYFSNTNLRGNATLVRMDEAIDFDWGTGSPDPSLPINGFSVRWTNDITFAPGQYRFTLTVDDGARLYIDGRQVINDWIDDPVRVVSADVAITSGTVPVMLEYREGVGEAQVKLDWTLLVPLDDFDPEGDREAVTATAVVTEPTALRQSFGFDAPVKQIVNQGTTVQLAGQRSADAQWIRVITPLGVWGWVEARVLQTDFPLETLDVWQQDW